MSIETLVTRIQQGIITAFERWIAAIQARIAQIESQRTSRRALLFRLLRQIGGLWGLVIFTVLARLVNQYAGIAILTLAAWGLGQVLRDPTAVSYGHVMIELVLFGVVKGIFYYLENYLGSYTALRLMSRLRTQLYKRLEPLAPAGLMHVRSGDIISRAIADVDQIEVFYSQTIAAAAVAVIVPLISLFVMSWFSGWLALLFFPFLLAVGVAVPVLTDDLSKKYSPRLREAVADVNAHMTESLQGWREIVSFGRSDERRREIHERNENLVRIQGRVAEVSGLRDALTESLIAACIASVFVVGLWLSSLGMVSFFDLPAVVALTYTTFGPMLAVRNVVFEFNQAVASANRLFEIMDQRPLVQDRATTPPAETIEPSIQFESVYFRYPKNDLRLMSNEEWFGLHEPPTNGKIVPGGAPGRAPAGLEVGNGAAQEAAGTRGNGQARQADGEAPQAEAADAAPAQPADDRATEDPQRAVGTDDAASVAEAAGAAPAQPVDDLAADDGTIPAVPDEDREQQPVAEQPVDEHAWVLENLSFEVPAGRMIALVGPSGAGKSTIVNLLLRFWDVDAGCVCIGGYDVRDFPLEDLRSRVGVVSQRTHIFNTTIRENILLGKPDATDEEIEQAARLANLHDFIVSLPDGYKTRVGEMGARLSGGQRQRLAIARALLKNAPILVLDEATSNLDAVNERAIQASIHKLMEGRTTLVIAHRLSTVVNADEILVMDAGRIVERGRHADLLARRGVYARLFANQQDELLYVVS